jgi:hypothetical protein
VLCFRLLQSRIPQGVEEAAFVVVVLALEGALAAAYWL